MDDQKLLDKTGALKDAKPEDVASKYPTARNEIKSKFIHCWIGKGNDNDYVVQLEPSHPQRPFPEDLRDVCIIVRKHLVACFPRDCTVEIDLPDPTWKIQHITFVATNAMKSWSFQPEAVAEKVPGMLEELDRYVEAYDEFKRKNKRS